MSGGHHSEFCLVELAHVVGLVVGGEALGRDRPVHVAHAVALDAGVTLEAGVVGDALVAQSAREVRSAHGAKGAVRVLFEKGMPGQSLGTKVTVA